MKREHPKAHRGSARPPGQAPRALTTLQGSSPCRPGAHAPARRAPQPGPGEAGLSAHGRRGGAHSSESESERRYPPGLRAGRADSLVTDRPLPALPGRQHSRLQHCEEGVGLRRLLQLTALLAAQPDDVTEGLRGVGLSLEREGDAALPSGLRRKASRRPDRGSCPLLRARKDRGLSQPGRFREHWLAFLTSGC